MSGVPSAASFFFGYMGAATALIFTCLGSAYGTAKSGVGVVSMGVMRPELVIKSVVPVVMAGVIVDPISYTAQSAFAHLASGLSVGFAGLGAGMSIGIVGDAGVRACAQQPQVFVGMILILIFCEALALYGLIIGLFLAVR